MTGFYFRAVCGLSLNAVVVGRGCKEDRRPCGGRVGHDLPRLECQATHEDSKQAITSDLLRQLVTAIEQPHRRKSQASYRVYHQLSGCSSTDLSCFISDTFFGQMALRFSGRFICRPSSFKHQAGKEEASGRCMPRDGKCRTSLTRFLQVG